jgi:hypothetical protein
MPPSNTPYVSKVLTTFVAERQQDYGEDGYVMPWLMPFVGVNGPTGIFYKKTPNWKRLPANYTQRGSKSPTNVKPDWSTNTDTYRIEDFALMAETSRKDIDNSEPNALLFSRQDEVAETQDTLMREHEIIGKQTLVNTLTGNSLRTGVASTPGANEFIHWDDSDDGQPLQDIERWCTYLLKTSGKSPNFAVIPKQVMSKLKFLSNFTQPTYQAVLNILTKEHFGDFFDIERIFIPKTTVDDAALGEDEEFDFIWGNEFILGYLPERPRKKVRAFGYTFVQTDVELGGVSESKPFRVRSYVDESRGRGVYCDIVESFLAREIVDPTLFLRIATPVSTVEDE